MKNFLLVGVGGFFGAMARYGIGLLVPRLWATDFPVATVLINLTGSFILGLFATLAAERAPIDPMWRLVIATGFVGAYTTFSTFEHETHQLVANGMPWLGLANVLFSVVAGYGAVHLGVMLAR